MAETKNLPKIDLKSGHRIRIHTIVFFENRCAFLLTLPPHPYHRQHSQNALLALLWQIFWCRVRYAATAVRAWPIRWLGEAVNDGLSDRW